MTDAILAAQVERDPFWALPQAQANRRTFLRDLDDEALAREYGQYVTAFFPLEPEHE